LLNVRNGTIDLRTGKLKKHDKADKITKLADVDFEPEKTDEKWEKFLADSTGGDAEFMEFLKRAAGYTLTGLTTEERCFFVYGVAASGKTTFLESIKSAMGEYAATINPDMLCKSKFGGGAGGAATPELARLAGIRLAAGSEIEQGKELAEAVIKSITGGETITARNLYAGLFEYRPQFALWMAMNHCPKASADDGAIWRRVLRLNFDKTVPPEKRDKSLKPYLATEGASAVLAWAVKGCLAWQKDGLGIPDCVQKSTEAYRAESDPLTNFFEDCVKLDSGAWTSAADVAKEYADYCAENGTKYPVSPQTLAKKLKAFGARADRRGSVRGWAGVRVSIDGFDAVDKPEAVEFLKPDKIAS
jgi:putative DNA primase/helicase